MEHTEHKKIMYKGIAINLAAYLVMTIFLLLLGVPTIIVFILDMFLIWGLFVMSYIHHKRKK
jgi:hypothetical protein